MIAWALLELTSHPVLDRSVLQGANVWQRDEIVQLLPDATQPETVFRIWDAFHQPYRLSFTFVARVLRVAFGAPDEWAPVVATRFGFADVDPLTALAEEPAG